MSVGPADRIGMLELPVLGVGAIGVEPDVQAARGQITLGSDVVAGEDMDRRGGGADQSR